MATKIRYLEVVAEEGFVDELNRLARVTRSTKAEVLSRAIALYSLALSEMKKENIIQFSYH